MFKRKELPSWILTFIAFVGIASIVFFDEYMKLIGPNLGAIQFVISFILLVVAGKAAPQDDQPSNP